MERIFDSPRRVRFVAANVAASDTVKGSHIQRNPLSMGALAEPEEWPRVSQSPKEKKRRDCVMTARLTLSGMQQRKLATFGTPLPNDKDFPLAWGNPPLFCRPLLAPFKRVPARRAGHGGACRRQMLSRASGRELVGSTRLMRLTWSQTRP